MRYFIIIFNWKGYSDLNGKLISGGFSVGAENKDGRFINSSKETKKARELLKKNHSITPTQVMIANILELNERDYLDFISD